MQHDKVSKSSKRNRGLTLKCTLFATLCCTHPTLQQICSKIPNIYTFFERVILVLWQSKRVLGFLPVLLQTWTTMEVRLHEIENDHLIAADTQIRSVYINSSECVTSWGRQEIEALGLKFRQMREKERQTERQRQTERDRETERQRQRQRSRQKLPPICDYHVLRALTVICSM